MNIHTVHRENFAVKIILWLRHLRGDDHQNQAFVLPNVDYCSIVWNHCGVMLRDRVERIQKYALRIIHGKPPRASSDRATADGTRLDNPWEKTVLVCLVNRCLSDEAPSFLCLKFRPNTALGYIRTRGANKLHLTRPKTEYFWSTFTFQEALLYNQLPETIRRLNKSKVSKQPYMTITELALH